MVLEELLANRREGDRGSQTDLHSLLHGSWLHVLAGGRNQGNDSTGRD